MQQFLCKTGEKLTTKSTKATKVDENVYQDFFVLFVSFVVRLLFVCTGKPRCDL
jgi:hypothetical protein